MEFTVEYMEYYLLVLLRISGFVATAPFFSYNTIPARMKAAISIMLTILVTQVMPPAAVSYSGVIGFSVLVLKETVVGVILGFMCTLCLYIINFAGQLIDMEIGLSMANMFDPMSNVQITVTGNIYNYLLMLLMAVTNMHYYVIRAIIDSFQYFGVGEAVFRDGLKDIVVEFMGNYFLIAIRIVLPVFCCILLMDVILGVLTKAAPQMNMFAVGIQIKVMVGVVILILLVQTIPMVSDFIFNEMKKVITDTVHIFSPAG